MYDCQQWSKIIVNIFHFLHAGYFPPGGGDPAPLRPTLDVAARVYPTVSSRSRADKTALTSLVNPDLPFTIAHRLVDTVNAVFSLHFFKNKYLTETRNKIYRNDIPHRQSLHRCLHN